MAHCGMPRIARRLGSVCQDTGRPRSDHADHGVCRTMAQRCSAPAQVVEGVSHQSARKKGRLPAPRRVNRRRHRPLPVSNLSFPYRWIPACPASQFFSLKNWHHPSHPFHYSQNFLLICSDTTDPQDVMLFNEPLLPFEYLQKRDRIDAVDFEHLGKDALDHDYKMLIAHL